MSSHAHFHLGPFLLCKTHEVQKEVKMYVCSNLGCSNHKSNSYDRKPFCSLCGSKMGDAILKKKGESCSGLDEAGVEEDRLCQWDSNIESTHLFTPNRRGPRPFGLDIEEAHGVIFDSPPDHEADKAWFEKEYAEELVLLRKAYDAVELKWGAVVYWC